METICGVGVEEVATEATDVAADATIEAAEVDIFRRLDVCGAILICFICAVISCTCFKLRV